MSGTFCKTFCVVVIRCIPLLGFGWIGLVRLHTLWFHTCTLFVGNQFSFRLVHQLHHKSFYPVHHILSQTCTIFCNCPSFSWLDRPPQKSVYFWIPAGIYLDVFTGTLHPLCDDWHCSMYLPTSNIRSDLYLWSSSTRDDLVSLWVLALRVRAACARLKPQRSLRSFGVVPKCLFDDRNVLGNPIYSMTPYRYWKTSSWYWANRIDFLSAIGFVSATIFFAYSCAQLTLSITWAAVATSQLHFFSKIFILSVLSSLTHKLDINLQFKYSILCMTTSSWLFFCSFCTTLACWILHQKITLILSKKIDLALPPVHHILFVET